VEFTYADVTKSNTEANSGTASRSSRAAQPTVSENVESVRSRLTAANDATSRVGDDASGSGISATSPDAIFSELQTLRKKYDAVVEYTVHLTAERDAIVTQLDTTQRELTKEKSKKRNDSTGGAGAGGKNDKGTDKKVVEKVSSVDCRNAMTVVQKHYGCGVLWLSAWMIALRNFYLHTTYSTLNPFLTHATTVLVYHLGLLAVRGADRGAAVLPLRQVHELSAPRCPSRVRVDSDRGCMRRGLWIYGSRV
jgi:hypothetical protein